MDYDVGTRLDRIEYKLELLLQGLSAGSENKPVAEKKV